MKSTKIVILISAALFFHASPGLTQNNHEVSKLKANNISVHSNNVSAYNPSTSRLGLQFGSGVTLGAAGGLLGGVGGFAVNGFNNDLDAIAPVILGTMVGYLAGGALGIYLVANSSSYDASFGYIILGNLVGAGVGIGGILLSENSFNSDTPKTLSVGLAFSAVIVGGIIANSLSIKKRSSQSAALLNFSGGHSQLAVPSMELTQTSHMNSSNLEIRNSYSPTVKLLNISL